MHIQYNDKVAICCFLKCLSVAGAIMAYKSLLCSHAVGIDIKLAKEMVEYVRDHCRLVGGQILERHEDGFWIHGLDGRSCPVRTDCIDFSSQYFNEIMKEVETFK